MVFLRYVFRVFYHVTVFTEGLIGRSVEGAQMIVLRDDEVLLVKTTYRPYWEFPGGKIEHHETPTEAAMRETKEEAAVLVTRLQKKMGTYTHRQLGREVKIHLFIAAEWGFSREWQPSFEIAERKFFAVNDLPSDISKGTLRRMNEFNQLTGDTPEMSGPWII